MTMVPISGDLVFEPGETQTHLHRYDHHCYYLCLNGKPFTPVRARAFPVRQDSTVPSDKLIEGEKTWAAAWTVSFMCSTRRK